MSKKLTEYQRRISSLLLYIDGHLGEHLSVDLLADRAQFSTFHFHRIFKSCVGVAPYEYILRRRLERAAALFQMQPTQRVRDVAFKLGFDSVENFSRQFKQVFEYSPSYFKRNESIRNRRGAVLDTPWHRFNYDEKPEKLFPTRVVQVPARRLAIIQGFYGQDGTALVDNYLHLSDWSLKHGYASLQDPVYGMSHDHIDITQSPLFKYDYAIEVPIEAEESDRINIIQSTSFKAIATDVVGSLEELGHAWNYLFKHWLPNNSYQPADRACMEIFNKRPEEIGWTSFDVTCLVPIQ